MNALETQWIVGFTDGEGCFTLSRNQNLEAPRRYTTQCEFVITQSKEDLALLHALRTHFGCGTVQEGGEASTVAYFRIRSVAQLATVVLPFFDQHPLRSRKQQEYLTFRKVVLREHTRRLAHESHSVASLLAFAEDARTRNRRGRSPRHCRHLEEAKAFLLQLRRR